MNSIVRPVNSILTVSEQYINSIFCPCIVKSRDIIVHVQEKKKKNLITQNVDTTIQTGT